jgi:hypothetical protein
MNKLQKQNWQAESDAETMARYQEILGDRTRMSRAIRFAKQKANDLTKRANLMNSIANTSNNRGKTNKARRGQ